MKKCDCLPAIKNAFCRDPYCESDRIPILVDFTGPVAKVIITSKKNETDSDSVTHKVKYKVKVNNYKL